MRDPGIGKDTMNGTASESWDIESVRDLTWLNLVFNTAADLGEDFAEIVG
jgi:hypothetical protein